MGRPLQLPFITAEPIKRKSALGGPLLSLGIAPLRERPESSTADRLRCPLWVKSRHQEEYWAMSALPPKADIGTQSWNVRFVPKADSCTAAISIRSPR